jgi:hypothetical protein
MTNRSGLNRLDRTLSELVSIDWELGIWFVIPFALTGFLVDAVLRSEMGRALWLASLAGFSVLGIRMSALILSARSPAAKPIDLPGFSLVVALGSAVVQASSETLFGCSHSRVTRPFTVGEETYEVCLDCGKQLNYSSVEMRRLTPWEVRRMRQAKAGTPPRESLPAHRSVSFPQRVWQIVEERHAATGSGRGA